MSNYNSKIIIIIQSYINELISKLELSKVSMDYVTESHVTRTDIVPYDFFEKEDGVLKSFGTPTILFNDLKNSTKLMKELEDEDILYYYSYYMYYSSKMLAEVLDLFEGKMIECTGDGSYSIFEKKPKELLIEYDYFEDLCYHQASFNNYLNSFNRSEYQFIKDLPNTFDEKIRQLFFYIFYIFNCGINEHLPCEFVNKFFTRVGCATGRCQIMRIENTHIRQDKLIGSVVHHSAHQASGKL